MESINTCELYGHCELPVKIKCFCTNPELYICIKHIGYHMMEPGAHTFEYLYTRINMQTKIEVFKYLSKQIKELEDLKSNIIDQVFLSLKEIRSQLENFVKQVNSQIKSSREVIRKVSYLDELSPTDNTFKYFKMTLDQALEYLKENNPLKNLLPKKILTQIYEPVYGYDYEKIDFKSEMDKERKEAEDANEKLQKGKEQEEGLEGLEGLERKNKILQNELKTAKGHVKALYLMIKSSPNSYWWATRKHDDLTQFESYVKNECNI